MDKTDALLTESWRVARTVPITHLQMARAMPPIAGYTGDPPTSPVVVVASCGFVLSG
jgi:hypothetical protein